MPESNPKTATVVVEQRGEGSAFLEMPTEKLCAVDSLEKEDSSDQQRWRSKAASHRASRGCL